MPEIGGIEVYYGVSSAAVSGVTLVVGTTLSALAVAASIARRRGRSWERREQALHLRGAVATPPAPRIGSHLVAIIVAVIVTAFTAVMLDSVLGARLVLMAPLSSTELIFTLVLAIVGTIAVALTGAMSSLGPAAGGLTWLIAGISAMLSNTGTDLFTTLLHPILQEPLNLNSWGRLTSMGPPWVLGLLLVGGAAGIHLARRAGRALQRLEEQSIASQATAWTSPRV